MFPNISERQIGIISPYKAQSTNIQNKLREVYPTKRFEVKAVDGFQGRENDIIIISCVRTNPK